MSVGENIKNRRKELGLNVEDLAKAIGKNKATVYRYENGDIESLPVDVLEPLAQVLKVTPADLMGWNETPDYKSLGLFVCLDDKIEAPESEIVEIHPSKILDFFNLLRLNVSVFSLDNNIPKEWVEAVMHDKEFVLRDELLIFTKALNVPADYFSNYDPGDYSVVSEAFKDRINNIMKDALANGFEPNNVDESNVLTAYRKAPEIDKEMVKRILKIN